MLNKAQCINRNSTGVVNQSVGRDREDCLKVVVKNYIGNENCQIDLPEKLPYDWMLFGRSNQIRTVTIPDISKPGIIKANWVSGRANGILFRKNFEVNHDLTLLRLIKQNEEMLGVEICYIPKSTQRVSLRALGKKRFLKISSGNSKGVRFSSEAIQMMLAHPKTKKMQLDWNVSEDHSHRLDFWKREYNDLFCRN